MNILTDIRTLNNLPTDCDGCFKDLKAMRSNALLGAEGHSNNGLLGAEVLFNLEHMHLVEVFRYVTNSEAKASKTDFEVLLANLSLNYGLFTLTTGRQFYGEPNTLRPFYGIYENYFYDVASSLDGVSLFFKKGIFSGKLLAARETDTNRMYAEKDYIYAANTQLELFKMFRLGAEYNYFMREEGYPREGAPQQPHSEKERISFLSFFTDITFFDKTKISMEYVYHYGKVVEGPYDAIYYDDYFISFEEPTMWTRLPKGSSFLISLNSEKDTRLGHIESRFVYLNGPKPDYNYYNRTENNHSYVYMGDIFSGVHFFDNFIIGGYINGQYFGPPPPTSGIQMYRLGATFNPRLPGNIRLSADFYSFASNIKIGWDQTSNDLGSELDLGLTFSPYYKMDIKLGYAVFMPGKGLKEIAARHHAGIAELDDIRQLSVGLNWQF